MSLKKSLQHIQENSATAEYKVGIRPDNKYKLYYQNIEYKWSGFCINKTNNIYRRVLFIKSIIQFPLHFILDKLLIICFYLSNVFWVKVFNVLFFASNMLCFEYNIISLQISDNWPSSHLYCIKHMSHLLNSFILLYFL